jgi:rhamnose transport system substrate-binding protein
MHDLSNQESQISGLKSQTSDLTLQIGAFLLPGLLALTLLLPAACNREGSAGDGSRVVYIPKNTGNPYFDPLIEGFRAAAEEHGLVFSSIAPDTADATSQLPIIRDQIQRRVAVIALSPNSPDALNPMLEDARRRGIRIVTVDSDLTGNEQYRDVGVLTVDPESVGEGQIELLGSMIDYRGPFAILSATTDAPNQNAWIAVMRRTLQEDPKYRDMELVEIAYGNDEPQKSRTEAEALMTKYPNLRGIIAPTTVGIAAAAQAVETARRAEQIVVTGLGTPNEMRRFIKNGTVKAFALWSPYDEGYLAGQVSGLLARGELEPAPGITFDAGKLGPRTLRENNIVITGEPLIFTIDNIDDYSF